MIAAALALTAIAILIHVYIFALETLLWTKEKTNRTFGITREQAEQTRLFAFNQGFYNLFLAAIAAAGIIFYVMDAHAAGTALITAGAGSMAAAGIVLYLSDRRKLRAALIQMTAPLLALIFLLIGSSGEL